MYAETDKVFDYQRELHVTTNCVVVAYHKGSGDMAHRLQYTLTASLVQSLIHTLSHTPYTLPPSLNHSRSLTHPTMATPSPLIHTTPSLTHPHHSLTHSTTPTPSLTQPHPLNHTLSLNPSSPSQSLECDVAILAK